MKILSPKISVLMPAYNAEKYIGEAIESILNQTFTEFEFIIDDCSTDRTWEIIEEYANKDKRIIAIKNSQKTSLAGSRNNLINKAKGKYIVWQDADDISLPSRLEHQFKFMEKHLEVGICGGWMEFFNDRGNTSLRKYKENDTQLRRTIFRYSPVAQPAAIIRKTVFDYTGQYDSVALVEDLDMHFRIGMRSKFANLQEIVIRYREYDGASTISLLKKVELKTISARLRYNDGKNYVMSLSDHAYNIVQYISAFVMPAKFRIYLFNFFRNCK